jgi:hypothetical protein
MCKCCVLYKKRSLLLTISVCYSWKMELNIGLDASFDNFQDCKGIRAENGKFKARKLIHIRNDVTFS